MTRFQLTNTGNSTQGYVLSVVNEAGTVLFTQTDNQDVNNLRIFVDSNGNGAYDAGTDTATNINSLITDADGESLVVFVVADIPVAATNNQYANVRLTARATPVGSTHAAGADGRPRYGRRRRRVGGRGSRQLRVGRGPVPHPVRCADGHQERSGGLRSVQPRRRPEGDPGRAGRVHDHRDQRQHDDGSRRRERDRQHSGEHHVRPGQHHAERRARLPDTNYQAAPTPRVVVNAGTVAANSGTATVAFTVTINN